MNIHIYNLFLEKAANCFNTDLELKCDFVRHKLQRFLYQYWVTRRRTCTGD